MPKPEKVPHPHLYNTTMNVAFAPLLRRYGGVSVHGAQQHLEPAQGPFIITPVHRSMLDIPVTSWAAYKYARKQIHFMAKEDLWKIPLLGGFIAACGAFSINRSEALSDDKLSHIDSLVENRAIIGIFPEGRRETGDTVDRKKIKRSVAALALHYGMPLLPVGIAGTEEGKRGEIHIVFGEKLNVEQTELDLSEPRSYVKLVRPVLDALHVSMNVCQAKAIEYSREL